MSFALAALSFIPTLVLGASSSSLQTVSIKVRSLILLGLARHADRVPCREPNSSMRTARSFTLLVSPTSLT